MNSIKNLKQIFFGGACCRVCGSFFSHKVGLCSYCQEALFGEECRTRTCERSKVLNHYLWRWSPTNSLVVGRLIEMQKQGKWETFSAIAAKKWASHLLLNQKGFCWQNTYVVPAPGKVAKDHAWMLARAFCNWTNLPLVEGLLRTGEDVQKNKSLPDRWKLKFERKVNFTPANRHFILIDDVVTTGATVLAAKEALGGGILKAVYSLSWREKLRQDS